MVKKFAVLLTPLQHRSSRARPSLLGYIFTDKRCYMSRVRDFVVNVSEAFFEGMVRAQQDRKVLVQTHKKIKEWIKTQEESVDAQWTSQTKGSMSKFLKEVENLKKLEEDLFEVERELRGRSGAKRIRIYTED
jgi:hypothetical protein